jgi:hypothetical protein
MTWPFETGSNGLNRSRSSGWSCGRVSGHIPKNIFSDGPEIHSGPNALIAPF